MTKIKITACFLTLYFNVTAQYYIRGEVKDEKGEPLQNVKIYMHSAKSLYSTGISGGFGITTSILNDTLTFSLQGYETKIIPVKCISNPFSDDCKCAGKIDRKSDPEG